MSQRYTVPTYTTGSGNPVTCPFATERIGTNGPLLLQDSHLIEVLASFNREKIPERIVHAKGTGAYGVFEVTHDVTQYTCAQFLQPNTSSKVFVRFSTVGGEKGSADTARDPRGFAVRFYTEEGNCDIVGNNTPIFFLRDPVKFSPFIHTQKRNPKTGLKDPNAHWTYVVEHQEALHQYFLLHSDRGTPASYREMHGYGSHTYKLVKENGQFVYVKFHFRADLGFKTLSDEEATKLAGDDPDHHRRDLYENIEKATFHLGLFASNDDS
ncbi:uncharacterized protein SAPINGB_P003313 [Magnusiomyces paraingens]|uniref:Catalase core domain-containing protein n=1 Tax=Magnusiomyces paraingens TaxID=2606893 RepID=A0A5E8BK72_9ASCO|nr:uncharacterized protein SAPINGB_P003313 [Saprochaete ingens]VVT52088.1 unnamed protein product [Saprochaete ingens]